MACARCSPNRSRRWKSVAGDCARKPRRRGRSRRTRAVSCVGSQARPTTSWSTAPRPRARGARVPSRTRERAPARRERRKAPEESPLCPPLGGLFFALIVLSGCSPAPRYTLSIHGCALGWSRLASPPPRTRPGPHGFKEHCMATAAQHLSSLSDLSPQVRAWEDSVARRTRPARIHWCEGSEAEQRMLIQELVGRGELLPLNAETNPGCYLFRSHPSDVARVEHLTFVCTSSQGDAGPNNNWISPA